MKKRDAGKLPCRPKVPLQHRNCTRDIHQPLQTTAVARVPQNRRYDTNSSDIANQDTNCQTRENSMTSPLAR